MMMVSVQQHIDDPGAEQQRANFEQRGEPRELRTQENDQMLEDRRNGVIVPQGDEEMLYQSMRELMLDRELRLRLGAAAESVPARFPWENTVDRLESVYRNVLGR